MAPRVGSPPRRCRTTGASNATQFGPHRFTFLVVLRLNSETGRRVLYIAASTAARTQRFERTPTSICGFCFRVSVCPPFGWRRITYGLRRSPWVRSGQMGVASPKPFTSTRQGCSLQRKPLKGQLPWSLRCPAGATLHIGDVRFWGMRSDRSQMDSGSVYRSLSYGDYVAVDTAGNAVPAMLYQGPWI